MMRWLCLVGLSVFLVSCASMPESVPARDTRVEQLTKALQTLSPQVEKREAQQLATVAVSTAAQLREKYGVSLTPWLHNVEVYWGLKERGYCYHYQQDLYAALKKVNTPHLQLHYIRALPKEHFEHNALSVTAKGAAWDSGLVLDAWRNAGVLVFAPVKEDKYPWQLSQ